MMKEFSDEEIVERLRSPDELTKNEALTYIYQKYYELIANLVRNNNGSQAEAKDVFQDTLIAFYDQVRKGNLNLSVSLQGYLYAIARNLWLKQLRSKKRNTTLTESHQTDLIEENFIDKLLLSDRNNTLARLLKKLDEPCRKLLLYFYYDRLSMKEIMKRMNLSSEPVTKNKKSNCMKKLKAMILENPTYVESLK